MKHFNYFLLDPAAKNRVNRAVIAAKIPENTGGGASQSCALRSEGAQVTSARSAVDVPMTSYGASDEHPMSTRSASDGTRWNSRVWKYAACMLMVLVMSIGQMWATDINDYATGFETTTNSWSKDGGTAGVLTRFARTGTGGAWHASNTTSAGDKRVKLAIGTTSGAKNTTYQHVIGYVRKGVGTSNTLTTKVEVYIGSSLGMSDALTLSTSWQRISYSKNKTSAWSSSDTQIRFTTAFSTSKADTVYFDDLIWYSNTSATIDLTRPSRATSASATTSSISWTNGSDTGEGATGIQATLIFHRTGGSVGGNDLTLNDQGIYSLTATEGPSVVGNWTLLSASVGAAATSYSGTFEAGHEYAIVHRDLAYNYSTPTYVTVAAGGGCSAPTSPSISGTTAYTAGETITLAASATGTSASTTYTWYKGATWDAASATTPVQAASTSGATFTKASCVTDDAGTYWCNISNGTGCEVQTSKTITVSAGGGGTTVTATWPMYSGNSLSLVGTASNSSITPSNAVATFPSNIDWGAVATVNYTDYTGKMVKITENDTENITGDNSSISYTTYVKYSLTVATGYTFKPTGFSARIGRQGTDNGCVKVVLKKGTTGIDSTAISKPARDNASTLVASTTYSKLISDADTYEAGDVIDLYVYLGGKMKNKSFVISDVSITGEYAEAAVSCTAPTSPTNGASTSSSRVVSWTAPASAPAGGYLVAYSSATSTAPGDVVQAAGTNGSYTVVAVAAGTTTATLSALSASTTYNWWVRSKCGDSSFSSWVAGTAFTTDAPPCGSTEQAALTLSSSSGSICGTGTTTFTVSGGSGSGALSVSSSDESKATASIEGSTVTVTGVAAGSATITVTKACDATYAEKTATYTATVAAVPTANAGADKTTELGEDVALAATAAADGCTGAWTIVSGPNTATSQLSSTSSATATFTPTVAGTYTLRWTVTNTSSSCSASDDMTVIAAVCSISSCGNATLTYPLNVGTSLVNTAANLVNTPSNGGSAALTVPAASAAVTLSTITISAKDGDKDNNGKAAATTSACYPTKPTMSSKIGMYSGSSYSTSNYLQFAFTVNSGYTFTPCDIQFTVQPVSYEASFRWEVTDGTYIYGYGVATDVPVGSSGGASVLTGLTSTSEMAAGDYYIRLYPYYNGSNTFRISNNVILKGTTAAVASDAYDIHIGKNNADYTDESLTNTSGTTWSKAITLDAGSYYEFKVKKTPSVGDAVYYGNNGKITATTSPAWDFSTSDGNCKFYTSVAGSYTFSWDASTSKLTVTYPAGEHPTKRIYMACGSTWCDASPKFFVHSWGVSEYNTQVQQNACGDYYADIIWYNDYFLFTRNESSATAYDGGTWKNYSQDLTYNSSQTLWTCTGYSDDKGNFSSSAYSPTTYTISYNKGTNGTGTKDNQSKTCGVAFTLPGSTFTYGGHTQDGWATADGGAIAYALSGSYTTNAVQEFFPHWKCNTPTITDNGDNTVTITVPSGTTVRYTTDGSTPTSSTGTVYSSAIDIAANVTIKAIAYQSNCTDSEVASQACTYHAPAASLTALVINTLYEVPDMIPSGATLTDDDQFFEGLSANTKFELIGSASSSTTPKANSKSTNDKTIDDITFDDGSMWFKGDAEPSSNIPTQYGLSFIVPEGGGKLYLYFSGTSTNIKLAKSGEEGSKPSCPNGYGAVDVTAGTYYLYGTGTTAPYCFYGLKLCSTYSVSITTTNVTKATGATGAGAAIKGKAYTATFTANTGYTLPSDVTVTIGGASCTKGTEYTWSVSDDTGTLTVNAANVTGAIVVTVSGVAPSCTAHGLTYASTSVAKNVGDAAFTNTLTNPNGLSVSYSSSNTSAATVNATSGLVIIVGAGSTTITATWAGDGTYCAGTATYTLTVSSDCTPQSLSKVSATKGGSGTVTGYNDGQYAGDAVVNLYSTKEQSASLLGVGTVNGYKMGDAGTSIVFATLKGTSFQADDKVRIGITKKNDNRTVDASTDILTIYYGTSKTDATALHTITGVTGAGFYEYTLTSADVTAIGSKKGIGLFRESDNGENPYVYSVEIIGCREWAVCPAPDAVAAGSVTHNSAVLTVTDAAATGNYEFYYSTSNTAPTASTAATATGSSLTKTITGLTASTTYYYWVRSNCGGVTKSAWIAGTPATFATTAAPSTYSVTYNGNGKTGGDVPTDDTDYEEGDVVTVKGNTGSLVKTGNSFVGWNTASDGTGTFYPAGYKFYMGNADVTLYAVYGSVGATCVTLTNFETSSYAKSSNKPDSEGKYFYGYKGTVGADYAVTITTPATDVKGANSGANLLLTQNTRFSIYADNTTTGGTPATYSDVTSISFKIKAHKNTKIPTIDVYVGSTKIKTVTGGDESKSDGHEYDTSGFTTITVSSLSNLAGIVKFMNTSSGSSDYKAYFDDIQICYGSGASSGHTVSFDMNDHGSAIADIENVPDGSKIGAPVPEPTATDWDFGGWYNEEGCSSVFNFASTTITADKILYAKWSNCAPTITTDPVAANYNQNGVASALTVEAATNGGGELHYQWWVKENDLADEDGSAIPGETGISFTPSTELLGTSYYYCVVSNDCGNVKTNTAAVTIRDTKPDPKAIWTVQEPTHGGKGFTFSVEVNKADDGNWDGTLEASMLTLSSEAVLDESSIVVNNTNKTISGTYGVKGSATSPVTFYLLLPATGTQSAKRLEYEQEFTECVGGTGDSYYIRVRKNYTKDGNYYHWANTDGWISQKISSSFSSEKASTKMGESNQFDSIYNTNGQYVWVRTYHANINKVRIYADFRANDMTVSNVYKHTDYFSEASKYIVGYTAVYNGSAATNLGDAAQGYVDITLEEPMSANDILLVKFSDAKVRTLGAVLTEGRSSGSLYTSLVWSNSQTNGETLEKREDDVDFAVTANRNDANALASLGTISYSSSNTSVATVNAATGQVTIADNIDFGSADYKTTTITATLAASGCYKRCVLTYVLQVNKYVCTEAVGTVSIKTDNACSGKELEVSGYEEGATIQWYKDGTAIPGETGTTYMATTAGAYYAVTHKDCDAVSNEITINFGAAAATKIVDSWYVKNDRRTPDIALVQTTNATGFTVTTGSPASDITSTGIGGCTFELKEDGIIYLHGTKANGDAPSDMTPGDMTITITATACTPATSLDIVLHIQPETAKPSIAFVVDGTLRKDGGTATSVLEAKTSDRPIWKYLANTFALTGCNAYWSVDSKELRQYYSQFDAILITDDPSTDTKGTGGVSYVKAFGTMVDVRPILTMEAYVGKFKDGGWHVYDATPSSPNPRQVEMKLECKNHDIFKGLDPAASANVRTTTDEYDNEYWHVIMVDTTQSPYHNTKSDYEALPALQGFDRTKFSNMLGVGTIFEEKLQAGVERQEEPAARMMILGIQNNAMGALTNEGKLIVKNALEYLLKTNMEDVNDCSNYFTNADGDGRWDNDANWTRGEVPDFETRARILRPVVIPGSASAQHVARVDIAASGKSKHIGGEECNGSITIEPQGALIVEGKVSRAKAPNFGIDDLMPTENSDLYIRASEAGNGTLIMDNSDGQNKAYVEMYSKAQNNGGTTTWQYIGVPHSDVNNAQRNYYDSWLYSWNPTNGWEVVVNGGAVQPWTGYSITHPEAGHTYVMEGTLEATGEVDIDVPANSFQIIGNSWTAPMQIHNFEDDDFGDIDPTIYFFNTGRDESGTGALTPNATGEARWATGTYVSVPIHSSPYLGKDSLISSMQGFYVTNTAGAGTLHLDYDKLVRPMYPWQDLKSGPMHAPASTRMRESAEPVVAKLFVSGSRYDDRLVILERNDFSRGYDRGWDGEKWAGSDASPMIWTDNENGGAEAVMATDEMEGIVIGFRAGEDSEYTFYFSYDGMEDALYLLDTDTKIYTRVLAENSYTFTANDKNTHYRFILTRNAPQIVTGCEQVDAGGGVKAIKFIKDDKMYILMNGVLYDATGKIVR